MTTSKIVIVSRTKMGPNSVCVGAYDVDLNRSIRLLDANGYNQPNTFGLNIGDVVTATYINKPAISSPHTEDVMLQSYIDCPEKENVYGLFKINAPVVSGSIFDCFGGKLFQPGNGALAIPNDDVPNHSVCFWRTNSPLVLNNFGKYTYRNGFRNILIQYVGFPDAIDRIETGSVVRLSLSRRWNVDGQEKLCWLQLSGWY